MSATKKWVILLSPLMAISLFLSACVSPTSEVVKETVIVPGTPQVVEKEVTRVVEAPVPQWTGAGFGGTLNVAMAEALTSIDAPASTSSSTQEVSVNINETLVAFGENYRIVPMLAESWNVSDDGKTYTFHLRQGVKFHNGEEMTSADVIACYERTIAISPAAARFDMVESYEAPDDYTVVFHLKSPTRAFLIALASLSGEMSIQPKSVIEGKAVGELKIPEEIIGTGPYRLAEYEADTLIVLKRYEDYQPLPGERDGAAGAKIPYFDEIDIHIVPESGSKVAGFEAGDYDIILEVKPAEYGQLQDQPGLNVGTFYPGLMRFFQFNDDPGQPGNNPKWRQAILAALDMREIGMFASGGDPSLFSVTPSLWPPGTALYLPDDPVVQDLYSQNDADKAKQLLDEVGYNGEELVYLTYMQPPLISQAVAKQLQEKLGLNIKIEVMDWPTCSARREEPTGWAFMDNDCSSYNYMPLKIRDFFYCQSDSVVRGDYCNSELDVAFDEALYAVTDQQEQDAWAEAQRIIYQDVPFIKFYDEPSFYATRDDIKGYVGWYRPRYFGVWREK
jgi:peptide/nickel transport system substrate-binding protein